MFSHIPDIESMYLHANCFLIMLLSQETVTGRAAYDKVAKCCHPNGIDPATAKLVNSTSNVQFDPPTRTREQAVAEGILPQQSEKSLQDVYNSREERELHELFLELGLSTANCNKIIETLRMVRF
jgi:hypothetical protein